MKEKRFLSILIIPSKSKRSISLKFPIWAVTAASIGFFVFTIMAFGAFYFSLQTTLKIKDYKQLKDDTKIQENKIQDFDSRIDKLKNDIKILYDKEEEIRNLLGENKYIKQNKIIKGYMFDKNFQQIEPEKEVSDQKYDFLNDTLSELNSEYSQLFVKVSKYKARYNRTPSIWPIYGKIRCAFGWRLHPIFGYFRMHEGVDIPSWVGAPIKAGANGIVKFAGWSKGYGFLTVIDHGYGYQTLYGHSSRIFVHPGQYVQKGQKIAAVGSTGISTGPHLHYEIRRWNKPINPERYLDLDIFTASAQLW